MFKINSWQSVLAGIALVAVVLFAALHVGYKRFMRYPGTDWMNAGLYSIMNESDLPKTDAKKVSPLAYTLRSESSNAPNIYNYWNNRRLQPKSDIYYAYYCTILKDTDPMYELRMLAGESIEPQNALYNVLLAEHYLSKAIKEERIYEPGKDIEERLSIKDNVLFEKGITQVLKAAKKPYLSIHRDEVLLEKVRSMPEPVLFEDYMDIAYILMLERFPENLKVRNFARNTVMASKLLLSDDREGKALELADTWQPLTNLLLESSQSDLVHLFIAYGAGTTLIHGAGSTHDALGHAKQSKNLMKLYSDLKNVREANRHDTLNKLDEHESCGCESFPNARSSPIVRTLRQHGTQLTYRMVMFNKDTTLNEADLEPSRMVEHVLREEAFVQLLLVVIAACLIATVIQTVVWYISLRRSKEIPWLVLPRVRDIAYAILLGVVLPAAVYWIYTRLTPFGGREYGWVSNHTIRFIIEMAATITAMFVFYTLHLKNALHNKLVQQNVDIPTRHIQRRTRWIWAVALVISLAILIAVYLYWNQTYNWYKWNRTMCIAGVVMAAVIPAVAYAVVHKMRKRYSLYYGTVALSMIPVYSVFILAVSLTLQPLLMKVEAQWLKRDKIFFTYITDRTKTAVGLSKFEQVYRDELAAYMQKMINQKTD